MPLSDQHARYLSAIRAGDTVLTRIAELLPTFEALCPESIGRIFVCDRVDEPTGDRVFDNLWVFSQSFAMESKQFLHTNNFDLTPMSQSVTYLELDVQEYDFGTRARKDSRISLKVAFRTISGTLTATGPNCAHLATVLTEILRPNLRTTVF